ncbi:MAG: hypothetical protein E7663_04775 [Ruminococcaceae bacterium]|nr:hypothetical protein [Oscillospiraceae bacterium]
MTDEKQALERKPDPEAYEAVQKQAESMTGIPAPTFESEEERERVMRENFMVAVCRFMRTANFYLSEIHGLLSSLVERGGEHAI